MQPACRAAALNKAKRLEIGAWVLIYAGGLLMMLGLFLPATASTASTLLFAFAALLALIGAALIGWRSRLPVQ